MAVGEDGGAAAVAEGVEVRDELAVRQAAHRGAAVAEAGNQETVCGGGEAVDLGAFVDPSVGFERAVEGPANERLVQPPAQR